MPDDTEQLTTKKAEKLSATLGVELGKQIDLALKNHFGPDNGLTDREAVIVGGLAAVLATVLVRTDQQIVGVQAAIMKFAKALSEALKS